MATYRYLGNLTKMEINQILEDFPSDFSIKVHRDNGICNICLYHKGNSICGLTAFPYTCSWLVLGNFDGHSSKEELETCFAIAEEISKILLYKVIFISDTLNSPNLELGKEAGYIRLLQNENYHSGNEVVLMAKDLDFKEEDYA